MASVWSELKRRNVVKVAIAYAVVGWLLIEVSSVLGPALNLPDWVTAFVAFLLILGFPVAMLLTWAYELTPEGMKKTKSVPLSESITKVTGRKLDFVIIGVLALTVGFLLTNDYLSPDIVPDSVVEETSSVEPAAEGSTPVVVEEQRDVLPNSVAVLLCDNLSPDPDDAFFAAGIHEEILNQLVKLRNMNVIARTSVLQYADAPPPIPQIAEELNVGAVMECSVRYAGDAIVVTAQLIDPGTNSHLWSDTYPGDMSDPTTVFAMQADIAMNIANAVGAEFSVEEQESIEVVPTDSPAAYALYLKALAGSQGWESALEDLDRAISLDPEFSVAHGRKAFIMSFHIRVGHLDADEWEPVARSAAETAIALDPTVSPAHAALASLHAANWRADEAQQAYERVYQLSPNDSEVLHSYGLFLRDIGEYAEAIRLLEREMELDPSANGFQLGITHRYAGNGAVAVAIFQGLVETDFSQPMRHMHLGISEIRVGNRDGGLTALRTAEELWGDGISTDRIAQVVVAYAAVERGEDVQRLVAEFEERADEGLVGNARRGMIYLALENYEQALQSFEAATNNPDGESLRVLTQIKANDYADPVLDQPRWRELRGRIFASD